MNDCVFSPGRAYRYTLRHDAPGMSMVDLFDGKRVMWIGLNPSTADENQLDPTLRRIRGFTASWGYCEFVMTNLFAFRATDPREMRLAADPVGPMNDHWLADTANGADLIVAAWGALGTYRNRANDVRRLLEARPMFCLGLTHNGQPRHPLYVKRSTRLVRL